VAGSPSLVNDVLIALSARAIGATVLTSNARDFAAIREVRSFSLTVVAV
jgi:predicted nucleic acid-binding protein